MKQQTDEIAEKLTEIWQSRIDGKISEARMRRDMLGLLEAHTINTAAQNRRLINDFAKTAKATREFNDSLNGLSGKLRRI